jgi:hypothetical protein
LRCVLTAIVGKGSAAEVRVIYSSAEDLSAAISAAAGCDIEESRNDGGHFLPVTGFGPQLLAAGHREAVTARAAVVLRGAPVGGDRVFMLQIEQKGIQGDLVDGKKVAADLLDTARDGFGKQQECGERPGNGSDRRSRL